MKNIKTFKLIVIAIGVLASIAFYVLDTDPAGRALAVFGTGGTDGKEYGAAYGEDVKALPEEAVEPGIQESSPVQESISAQQIEALEEIFREAVREELMSICEEGYLELALGEAAQLAAQEAEARKGMVNINTANAGELMTLPGIGESKAADIIAYREEAGGFSSTEELMNVSGIGEATFEKLKDDIYV